MNIATITTKKKIPIDSFFLLYPIINESEEEEDEEEAKKNFHC